MTDGREHKERSSEAPPELVQEIQRLEGKGGNVPIDANAVIRRRLRQEFLRRRANRWRFVPWSAAAAAILFIATLWILEPWRQPRRGTESDAPVEIAQEPDAVAPVLAGDVTGDGRVNILDAFALARRLELGAIEDAAFDVNGDGEVDGSDVDAVAMQAVSLEGRSG